MSILSDMKDSSNETMQYVAAHSSEVMGRGKVTHPYRSKCSSSDIQLEHAVSSDTLGESYHVFTCLKTKLYPNMIF